MIDTDKYEGHAKGNWNWGKQGSTDNGDGTIMIRPFTQLESKSGVTLLAIHHGDAKQSDLKLIADAPLLLEEVKRLREALYKCWKDSGQSLYYLQVELLNDQEHWYQEMMCEDGSCEDCECGEKVIE